MKRYGYLYCEICSFPVLYRSCLKALRGHKTKAEAAEFLFFIDRDLEQLRSDLQNGTYKPQDYRYFEIYEPKQRTISVATFRDRVVHHALIEQLEPIYEKSFIFHSYATRKKKGNLKAILQAQKCLKMYDWYLKFDIRKYFDSIDHSILLNILKRKIKDNITLDLIRLILATSRNVNGDRHDVGLPIGNFTSQFFANVYLDGFDHFVIQDLGLCYIRYMDDMVIFCNDKSKLKHAIKLCEAYLYENLHLVVKPGSVLINTRIHGLPFLGFRIFPNVIRLKRENLTRMVGKIKQRQKQYLSKEIDEDQLYRSVQSMIAFAKIADTATLIGNVCKNLG